MSYPIIGMSSIGFATGLVSLVDEIRKPMKDYMHISMSLAIMSLHAMIISTYVNDVYTTDQARE